MQEQKKVTEETVTNQQIERLKIKVFDADSESMGLGTLTC
jgi:hypothetical protein